MKAWNRKTAGAAAALALSLTVPGAAFAADTGWLQSGGLYEIRTWAGHAEWGGQDGPLAEATLFKPHSLAVRADGSLAVSDSGNHLIRLLASNALSTYAGHFSGSDEGGLPTGSYHDDLADRALFDQPLGIAFDAAGNAYVADAGNHAIRKIGTDGKVTTLAGSGLSGAADGKGGAATFYAPSDVAVDAAGNVFVADTLNHTIRKIAPDGTVKTLNAPSTRVGQYLPGAAESFGDYADGPLADAKFNEPSGLALDAKGNLYVSDRGNQRIRYIDFAAGTVSTVAGTAPAPGADSPYAEGDYLDGPAAAARFDAPEGLAIAPDGTLIIADSLNHVVRLLKDGQVSTLAGEATEPGAVDGVLYAAKFDHPTDVAVLADGSLAIADEAGNKIRRLEKYAGAAGLKKDGAIKTLLNGSPLQSDKPAFVSGGATYLPLRAVGQATGFKVTYDAKTKSGKLTKGDTVYTVANGQKKVAKDAGGTKSELTLNAAPVLKEGSFYVPVRFFATEGDLDIQWDASVQAVIIRSKTF
ncbi:stalk domain-containing protein [Cohnella sp. GbtcB17]|uniref:stalk domain-containing protein n=1 Tax=Cohnella sp. GbtcB17 TaxID=2824762 RepID=UPI001C309D02|nr:stalk domain-containing protein [Cohnella sp. GbtcB17]